MFSTKYKTRKPEETVKLIENFFNSEGYVIKVKELQKTDINSYFARIYLYYDDYVVLKSNGKGLSEEFCLASAYAELYERYCNYANYLTDINNYKELIKNNYNSNGYFLDKNEIIVENYDNPKDEAYNLWFSSYFPNEEYGNKFLKAYNDNLPSITIPFKNVFEKNNNEYFDIRLCHLINTSTGMSAGNTETEALNQGISEIFERIAFNDVMMKPQEKYYELDLLNMDLPKQLKDIILILKENKNLDFKCYDLGYNFNYPVLLGILLNKKDMKIYPTLGSFADFNIALERILTELYQGTCSFNTSSIQEGVNPLNVVNAQTPFDYEISKYIMFGPGGSSYKTSRYFNENILITKNLINIKEPSSAFINKIENNINNETIFNFYKNLSKQLNINLYFRNNSLIQEVSSVFIYTTTPIWTCKAEGAKTIMDKKEQIDFYSNYRKFCNSLLSTSIESYVKLEDIPYRPKTSNIVSSNYLYHLTYSTLLTPESFHSVSDYAYMNIFEIIKYENNLEKMYNQILKMSVNSCIFSTITKYATIFKYKQKIKDNNKTYYYLKDIGFDNILLEEVENVENKIYLFNKIQESIKESWNLSWSKIIRKVKI